MAAYDNPANDNDNANDNADEDDGMESKPLVRETNVDGGKATGSSSSRQITGSSSSRQLTGSNSSKGVIPVLGTIYSTLANSDGGATNRDGKGVVYTSLATESRRNSTGSTEQVREKPGREERMVGAACCLCADVNVLIVVAMQDEQED
jgi:hypothetical protein